MVSGLDGVATVVAGLSRAAGSALDPTSVLERTMRALGAVVPVHQADLWRADRRGPRLVASDPPRPEGAVGPVAAEGAVVADLRVADDGGATVPETATQTVASGGAGPGGAPLGPVVSDDTPLDREDGRCA